MNNLNRAKKIEGYQVTQEAANRVLALRRTAIEIDRIADATELNLGELLRDYAVELPSELIHALRDARRTT